MVNKQLWQDFIIVIGLIVIFMAGGHLMDISDVIGDKQIATNGFMDIKTSKLYHVGYYLMYGAFMLILLMYVYLLIRFRYPNDKQP